ncbi:MAG: protoheme IX farnesyltransferase [Alphaproteobacteria bacterium]|nr:protoheme IX farnesyltransferase [Alphaproteobacteria bacterium]
MTALDPAVQNGLEPVGLSLAGPADYFDLLKPRVMSLVVFTALVGMVTAFASGAEASVGLAAISLLAISVGAGASGALNMWFDADIDAVMERTSKRPVPRGAVPPAEAAALGVVLSALSIALLALSSNYVAAGLLAFTIFFYAVIYSMWLKRATAQNIVIGGAAGALPPVVAWAAVTGDAPWQAWALFGIIFLWTPPHFWALALRRTIDYERVGVPMMPNVAGDRSTKLQIFAYSVALSVGAVAVQPFGLGGPVYLVASVALGAQFIRLAWAVLKSADGDGRTPMKLFGFSILYLFALFAALLAEGLFNLLSKAIWA